jgi:hypothetical protein
VCCAVLVLPPRSLAGLFALFTCRASPTLARADQVRLSLADDAGSGGRTDDAKQNDMWDPLNAGPKVSGQVD